MRYFEKQAEQYNYTGTYEELISHIESKGKKVVRIQDKGFYVPSKSSTGNPRLGFIYIKPQYRNKGIGTKVTKDFLKKHPDMTYNANKDNKPSRKIAKKIGITKQADLKEWIANRGEDWDYLKYLVAHKYNVLKGGREIDAPTWDLIKHDWSKFKPSIWVPYREQHFGQKNTRKFRAAVNRHAKAEEHHDYKYNNPEGTIVPNKENFADWWAVSKSKNPNILPIKQWLRKKGIDKNIT